MSIRNLKTLFKPRSVAVIGKGRKAGAADAALVRNLMLGGFEGPVMPVNPDRQAVHGILAYPSLAALPLAPDLAIITTPLEGAPATITELGARGTRAVLLINDRILTPRNEQDRPLIQALLEAARPHTLRLLGPDGLGFAAPPNQLNATLSQARLGAGGIALIGQSGAVMRAVMDWAEAREIGFSHLISTGARIDVDFADLLDYLAQDGRTRAILLYLEGTRKSRKFMSAARIAARIKPVIVLKPQGADPVEEAVYDAAFRRAGILRVGTIEQLFNSVETLATVKPIRQDGLVIVSNSRSIALLAGDALQRAGGRLAGSDDPSRSNPLDLGDQAGPEDYEKALRTLLATAGVGAVLVLHSPTSIRNDLACARAVAEVAAAGPRPVLTSWLGAAAGSAQALFKRHKVASYRNPEAAVEAFVRLVQYGHTQALLTETPASVPEQFVPDTATARAIVRAALDTGRARLNPYEAGQLLGAYGIAMLETRFAADPDAAADVAAGLGNSLTLKILSPDLAHKSDVGGVVFGLESPREVRKAAVEMQARVGELMPGATIDGFLLQPTRIRHGAFELTLGVRTGRGFGPVLRFGHGGTEAEVIDDLAYALPPLNMHLARELMGRTRIFASLDSRSGRRADLDAIAVTLLKVAQLVIDLGEIVSLDINPLWADARGVIALDAVVEIAACEPGHATRRLAIHPYPRELEQTLTLDDGRTLMLRPIMPEDAPPLRAMVQRAPAEDLRLRFFQPIRELSHAMAARLTQLDYDREMAFAVTDPGPPGEAEIWGVVRLTADSDLEKAEYAILLDRAMIGRGLGRWLLQHLIDYARSRGIGELYGEVLRENRPMLKLNQALGFTIGTEPDDPSLRLVTLRLDRSGTDDAPGPGSGT
ncbi:MAG: bifunctional acetate--CoA ligase family protein/GNAT family N-acetyltransferase [Candidatus Competibacterales bacterium]|nr:bifunctional acetate--CoA ligase family protein/GNAT family N-acetyltransferase [Candidatus Competibacterales bacterium]